MNILIIEDEEPASKRLAKLLHETDPEIKISDTVVSIQSAVNWIKKNNSPDIMMMDIHLADGISFEIFKQVEVKCPVIFTTAYNEYAIEAFKVNSIDYLLKPIKKDELKAALDKYKKLHGQKSKPEINFAALLQTFSSQQENFKKRFVIRFRDQLKMVETDDVSYFFTQEKINFLCTKDGKHYPVDYNLEQLEEMLDPKNFFRINRQFIINIHAIEQMFSFSKSRVKIKLNPPTDLDTIVSAERSHDFKIWIAGGN